MVIGAIIIPTSTINASPSSSLSSNPVGGLTLGQWIAGIQWWSIQGTLCVLAILSILGVLGILCRLRVLGILVTGVGTFGILGIQGRVGYRTSSTWKPLEFPTNYPPLVASGLHRIQSSKHLSFRCASYLGTSPNLMSNPLRPQECDNVDEQSP